MADIEALVDRASGLKRQGPRCWAEALTGEAKDFMEAVERRIADGDRFTYPRIAEVLDEEFGVKIGPHTVGAHLKRRCRCPR